MNVEELKELLELISQQNITEFELEEKGVKLKIRKAVGAVPSHGEAGVEAVAPPATPALPVAATENPAAEPAEAAEDGLSFVTSPMVGTFYRQPEPGADPFAREGDAIKKGQVLCIIEAMKLMNEIESEIEGELVKVFVDNGQPVQFGDRLFAVRPA